MADTDLTISLITEKMAKYVQQLEGLGHHDPLANVAFNLSEAKQLLATMQREKRWWEALQKISRKRRTYNGKPCKDEAADIADDVLRSEYTLKEGI